VIFWRRSKRTITSAALFLFFSFVGLAPHGTQG
jgi:hypothetical protein